MNRFTLRLLWIAAATLMCASHAAADEVVVQPAHKEVTMTRTRPSRSMLKSGAILLGVPYLSSIVVAATSEHKGDQRLYVPVAGPWMDLSDRDCTPNKPCKNEGLYKGLLIADGVFQGLGALEIVGAFVFPETMTTTRTTASREGSKPPEPGVHVRFAPGTVGGGYGLLALGKF